METNECVTGCLFVLVPSSLALTDQKWMYPLFFCFPMLLALSLQKRIYPRKTTKLEPESRLLQVCVSDWEGETLLVGKSKHKERSIFLTSKRPISRPARPSKQIKK